MTKNMKKIFHSIMLAAMVLSTVACSQEELTSSYFSDAKAVKISAQIGTSDVTGSFRHAAVYGIMKRTPLAQATRLP